MKKLLIIGIGLLFLFGALPLDVNAYVSVRGYYRSDGTYVRSHVRSNPNGLKYDNYSWTPSQGLYNKTYGTRGSYWDTPTYITDPDYYIGKQLYESGASSYVTPSAYSYSSLVTPTNSVTVPANATPSRYSGWYCNDGYKTTFDSLFNKVGCEKIIVPQNASLSYSGNTWYCDSGYKTKFDSSFNKIGCERIAVPQNASLNYFGTGWYCDSGYKTVYDRYYNKTGCTRIIVPPNAYLNYSGTGWYCNDGYKVKYDAHFNRIGCELSY